MIIRACTARKIPKTEKKEATPASLNWREARTGRNAQMKALLLKKELQRGHRPLLFPPQKSQSAQREELNRPVCTLRTLRVAPAPQRLCASARFLTESLNACPNYVIRRAWQKNGRRTQLSSLAGGVATAQAEGLPEWRSQAGDHSCIRGKKKAGGHSYRHSPEA